LWKAVKTKPDTVVQHHNSSALQTYGKESAAGNLGAATHFVLTATGCFHLLPFDASSHNGNKRYARLISFRALNDAEPIAAKAKKAIRA
jgi:hypothetical protein